LIIAAIKARQVYDSRGNPTVEADVILESGVMGRTIVPSGVSTGSHEAQELRDGDPTRFRGRSVYGAIRNIQTVVAPRLIGTSVADLAELDRILIELDGTPNKSRLGANTLLAVSAAAAHAGANERGLPLYSYLGGDEGRELPMPITQVIGGGAHAAGVIDVQDFSVIPIGAESFTECLEILFNVHWSTRDAMQRRGKPVSVADEGGFWPTFSYNEEGLEVLMEGIERSGYKPWKDVAIGLDIAASEFYAEGRYWFRLEKKSMTAAQLTDLLEEWVDRYPILSIEDGMAEDDWHGWERLTRRLGDRVQIIGDDLFTTDVERIRRGVSLGVANAALIKMNQIGTITETIDAIKLCQQSGYLPIVSARSGDSEDVTTVHIAVATNAGQIKNGAWARSCRLCKYNEESRIEEALAAQGVWRAREIFARFLK
jgi:enolase